MGDDMRVRWFSTVVLSLLLVACGGGGGADSSNPAPSTGNPPSSSSGDGGNNSGGSGTPSPQPDPTPGEPQPPSSGNGAGNGGSDSDNGGTLRPAPGPLTNLRFENPREIEADENGNLYVVDGPYEAARIRQIAPDGSISTLLEDGGNIGELAVTLAGNIFYSTVGFSQDDNSARADTVWTLSNGTPVELASSDIGMVQEMAVDPGTNDVYLSSTWATVKRIMPNGVVTTLFSFEQGGLINAMAFRNGTLWMVRSDMPRSSDIYRWTQEAGAEEVTLNSQMPFDSIVPTDTGLYITQSGFSRFSSGYISCLVELLDPGTGEFTSIAGNSGTCGYQDGAGESATFNLTSSMAQGSDGNLYVTDLENDVIRRVTPQGQVSLFAGVPGESGF